MAAPIEPTSWPATISTTGEANGVLIVVPSSGPFGAPGILKLGLNGTYATGVLVIRSRLTGMTTFYPISGVDVDTNAAVGTSGSFTLTDNASYLWKFPVAAYDEVEVYASTLASGSITVERAFGVAEVVSPPVVNATISNSTIASATTITSTSANALAVGANGTTNPVFNVNASASSVATGITVVGAAAAGGVAVTVISSGTNEALTINAKGSGTIGIGTVSTGAITLGAATGVTGAATITSTSASALAVGANGATNPVLKVNANTGSVATGLSVTGAAAAGGLAVAVISSGTNEALTINAKGSGTITIGGTSTGNVLLGGGGGIVVVPGTLTGGGLLTCAVQVATSGPLIYSGSGVPTISAAVKGSLYLRSDGSTTSTRAYIATDTAGTWTAITTAA